MFEIGAGNVFLSLISRIPNNVNDFDEGNLKVIKVYFAKFM